VPPLGGGGGGGGGGVAAFTAPPPSLPNGSVPVIMYVFDGIIKQAGAESNESSQSNHNDNCLSIYLYTLKQK
jgi:hypothetical protein